MRGYGNRRTNRTGRSVIYYNGGSIIVTHEIKRHEDLVLVRIWCDDCGTRKEYKVYANKPESREQLIEALGGVWKFVEFHPIVCQKASQPFITRF